MRPTQSRTALAVLTTTAFLGAGASSAQAATWSPFAALNKAKANAELTISQAFAIKPGKVKKAADGTVVLSNSTVQVGNLSGTGVTAKATETGVVLTGGTYVAPTSLTDNTLKSSTSAPLTVSYSTTGVTAISGELTSTKSAATEQQLDATIGEDLQIPVDAVPAAPTNAPWAFKLNVDIQGLVVKGSAGYAALDGRIYWTGAYNFGVSLNGLPFNGGTIGVAGSVSGSNIFKPLSGFALKGSINGAVNLGPQTQLLGGSVEWSAKGFTVGGTLRLQCSTGYLDASASGTFSDAKNFKFHADGLASECTLGKVARFDEKTFSADLVSTDGVLKYDAGFSGAHIELFSKFITKDAEVNTYLDNVNGKISNTCKTCTGNRLQLSFGGTGVGQTRDWKRTAAAAADPAKKNLPLSQLSPADRTSKTSFKTQGTVSGVFDLNGASVSKVSVKLTGVKFNLFTIIPSLAMQKAILDDTTNGFTA